jgi:ubiquitin-like modifier-activating enzyme ATG7
MSAVSDVKQVPLKYDKFGSMPSLGFWLEFFKKKLEDLKLDTTAVPITGSLAVKQSVLSLTHDAFSDGKTNRNKNACPVQGWLYNTNSKDAFRNLDKAALATEAGKTLVAKILNGAGLQNPAALVPFLLLSNAELKIHTVVYWCDFPTVILKGVSYTLTKPVAPAAVALSDGIRSSFQEAYVAFVDACADTQIFFCIAVKGDTASVHALSEFKALTADNSAVDRVLLGFCDPATSSAHPSMLIRNLLATCVLSFGVSQVQILALRDHAGRALSTSLLLNINIAVTAEAQAALVAGKPLFKTVGWERNSQNKLSPRVTDLSRTLDPHHLATSAVDLNLKLMRWRAAPELDLDNICNKKCLLLGAGTLGCNVARNLQGWGVKHITFLDCGNVSYSNPVRQSLYNFEDCANGVKPKAEAAAAALRRIYPGTNSTGVQLMIPMPGHAVAESQIPSLKADFDKFVALVESHDIIFLLTDSRESRWLPTVLGAAHDKMVLNTALGFDSFVVMRHGTRSNETPPPSTDANNNSSSSMEEAKTTSTLMTSAQDLGCYFCNDVVAPGDSSRDRTLDQQCTVARPGLAYMSSAAAVELAVTLTQHPQGKNAPATRSSSDTRTTVIGNTPHQLRGFLNSFALHTVTGQAFNCCTGCSPVVLKEYKEKGFDFLLKVLNTPGYLEDLTGLTQLQAEAEAAAALCDITDSDDDF